MRVFANEATAERAYRDCKKEWVRGADQLFQTMPSNGT